MQPENALNKWVNINSIFLQKIASVIKYITEKYWSNPFKINAVPIVHGGSNYSDPQLAIPGSFISALDFKTPKDLVEYIMKVDSNNTLYKVTLIGKNTLKIFKRNTGVVAMPCVTCVTIWKEVLKFPKIYFRILLMKVQNVD